VILVIKNKKGKLAGPQTKPATTGATLQPTQQNGLGVSITI